MSASEMDMKSLALALAKNQWIGKQTVYAWHYCWLQWKEMMSKGVQQEKTLEGGLHDESGFCQWRIVARQRDQQWMGLKKHQISFAQSCLLHHETHLMAEIHACP